MPMGLMNVVLDVVHAMGDVIFYEKRHLNLATCVTETTLSNIFNQQKLDSA